MFGAALRQDPDPLALLQASVVSTISCVGQGLGGKPGCLGDSGNGHREGSQCGGDPEGRHPDVPISPLNLAVSRCNRSSPNSVPAGPAEKDGVKKSAVLQNIHYFPKWCKALIGPNSLDLKRISCGER